VSENDLLPDQSVIERIIGRSRWAAQRVLDFPGRVRALLVLVIGIRSSGLTELWIGDSHAVCLNRPLTTTPLSAGPDRQVIWHLGPRLMHTIARRGYPAGVRRAARWIRRVGRPGTLALFVSAGEIDVRCHLVQRATEPGFNLDFIHDYVAQSAALAEEMGAAVLVIAAHLPPSAKVPNYRMFPVRGTLEERIAMSERVRERLHDEVAACTGPVRCLVLDLTDMLSNPDGSMDQAFTHDGVHTNQAGIELVRRRVLDLDLPR
jgi:hypothetical protein